MCKTRTTMKKSTFFITAVLCILCAMPVCAQGSKRKMERERQELLSVLGKMPRKPEPDITVLDTAAVGGGTRYTIKYLAEAGGGVFNVPDDWVYAYLFVPADYRDAKLPAVVAVHQDDVSFHIGKDEAAGLAGSPSMHYGLELFERGYVVICPDRYYHGPRRWLGKNPYWSPGKDDYERDLAFFDNRVGLLFAEGRTHYSKEAYDLSLAVDVLCSLDFVDDTRIGAIGHSAGGVATAFLAFYDTRIAAGISSCGVYDVIRAFRYDVQQPFPASMSMPGLSERGFSTGDYIKHIAPRSFLITRGMYEWGKDDPDSKEFLREAEMFRDKYLEAAPGGDMGLIFFDEEGGGHDFPPGVREQAYEWLDKRLKN